jgi:hypothetical protein
MTCERQQCAVDIAPPNGRAYFNVRTATSAAWPAPLALTQLPLPRRWLNDTGIQGTLPASWSGMRMLDSM